MNFEIKKCNNVGRVMLHMLGCVWRIDGMKCVMSSVKCKVVRDIFCCFFVVFFVGFFVLCGPEIGLKCESGCILTLEMKLPRKKKKNKTKHETSWVFTDGKKYQLNLIIT